MDRTKAHSVLGTTEDTSEDDLKKAYKKTAAKYHPDRNKESDAEEKFKEVNEAYQYLTTGQGFGPTEAPAHTYSSSSHGFSINIEDLLRQHGMGGSNRKTIIVEDKHLNTTISFRESVLGCQKPLSYSRKTKCDDCNGQGKKQVSNGCTPCKGTGFITMVQGHMTMRGACGSCRGATKYESCVKCKEDGFLETNISIEANIPPGVHEGRDVLRLVGIGDYAGHGMIGDAYTDVILHVKVEKSVTLKIEGNDVVTGKKISLLEALEGTEVTVPTIDGITTITIPPQSKNKDEVILPNLGVNRVGNERVKLYVLYPPETDKLIKFLKNQEN